MQLAETVRDVLKGERAVLEVDAALHAWILQRAVRLHLESSGSACSQVGIEGLGQLQVDGSAGGKVQLLRTLELQVALGAQVGVLASHMNWVESDARIGQCGVHTALALQVDAGNRYRQFLKAGFATHP